MTAHTAVSAPLSGRSFLFLHAHPDDEAIFTGITMRRLSALGARVILVTATAGEEGGPADVRVAELEAACTALGVARLELLGRRDSGMAGTPANQHPWALARADIASLVRQLADLCAAESAEALVHYDADGIYGHPEPVSCTGSAPAQLRAGITGYEATVDGVPTTSPAAISSRASTAAGRRHVAGR